MTRKQQKDARKIFLLSESLTARFQAQKPGVLAELVPEEPKSTERLLAFRGTERKQWHKWREKLLGVVKQQLGVFPDQVPLNSRIVEQKKFPTYIREKVIFDSERFMSVPAWVCSPRKRKAGEKFPAVLCSHGPGPGKDPLVGLYNGQECLEYHKLIAIHLAEQGYVAIAPDWRLYGERAEPVQSSGAPGDAARLIRLAEEHFHYTLLGLNVWDGIRTFDYLTSRPEVDAERIGCLGVCLGSFIVALLALCDRRVTALALSGYLGTEQEKIMIGDWLGRQEEAFPNFHTLAAAADVAGLLAPLPLLMQSAEYDYHLSSTAAARAFRQVKKIYRAAGAANCLEWDFFDGSYEINVPPIMQFFNQRLKTEAK